MYRHTFANYEDVLIEYALDVSKNELLLLEYLAGDIMYGGTESDRYILKTVDLKTGTVVQESNVAEQLECEFPSISAVMFQGRQLYGVASYFTGEESRYILWLYDVATGTMVETKEYADIEWEITLIQLSDGRAAIAYAHGGTVTPIRAGGCTLETAISVEEFSSHALFGGGNEYLFLCNADDELYGYTADGGEVKHLLSWADRGVLPPNKGIAAVDFNDKRIFCVVQEDGKNAFGLYTLTPCTPQEAPKDLIVVGYGVPDSSRKTATVFNQTYSEYTAKIIDYIQYNGDTDGGEKDVYAAPAGILKLNTELLAGKAMDVLCLDGRASSAALIRQGALLDLYPLIDDDNTMGRDSFVEGVLSATEIDGHLYQISTGFTLTTMVANKDLAGEADSLNLSTWDALQTAHPEVKTVPLGFTNEKFLNFYCDTVFSDYIDKDRKTCHFNDGSFEKYLEKSKEFTTQEELMQLLTGSKKLEASNTDIAKGKYLFAHKDISNFMLYHRLVSYINGKLAFVGYPTENGVGHKLTLQNSLAIVKSSKNQDAAWNFLKISLEENRETDAAYSSYFPTDRQTFENQAAYYQNAANFQNGNGSAVLTYEGNPAVPLSAKDMEQLQQMIRDAKPVVETDAQINAIILSEASYYYADVCTAKEASQNIQTKVQLYLNEQG